MKKTSNLRQAFVLVFSLTLASSLPALAQKTPTPPSMPAVPRPAPPLPAGKPNEVTIKIIETTDANEIIELNRSYRADGMTDERREAIVNKLVDSLRVRRNGRPARQMSIIVEDSRNADGVGKTVTESRVLNGYVRRPDVARPNNFQQELNIQMDSLGQQMKRFQFNFPSDFGAKLTRPFESWAREANAKPASIRGLDAYPNNPDRNLLNVRFSAPATGDVLMVVTNTKGKEVARKTLNNFTGEFVGQLDLGKQTTGTFFVTVTQNDDGAVRRIVIE